MYLHLFKRLSAEPISTEEEEDRKYGKKDERKKFVSKCNLQNFENRIIRINPIFSYSIDQGLFMSNVL